jgi:hypothetical protein
MCSVQLRVRNLNFTLYRFTPEAALNPAACPEGMLLAGCGSLNEEFEALMAPE